MKTEESRTGKKHEFSSANERHCGTETYHEPLRKPSLNDKYRKLQRAGLKKLIEMEKERADQQSMLRWTMRVQATTGKLQLLQQRECERGEKRARSTGNCKKTRTQNMKNVKGK